MPTRMHFHAHILLLLFKFLVRLHFTARLCDAQCRFVLRSASHFPSVNVSSSNVYVCASVNEYVRQERSGFGRQVPRTTNTVRRPVGNQGLLTRLVNALTKMEPTRDPVPKTTTPQTEKLRGSERKETDLTAGFHRRHTAHIL